MASAAQAGSLHQRTLELLRQSGKSLPILYKETGIPFFWLRKFSSGVIKNPSVNRVQALYEYLSSTKLPI